MRLGMTVNEMLGKLDSAEISEWMAYDMTCDSKWIKQQEEEREKQNFRKLSQEEQLKMFKQFFKGSK